MPVIKPIHDWTSHHRTAFEYWAVNYQPEVSTKEIRAKIPMPYVRGR